jgi:hypothetical protein
MKDLILLSVGDWENYVEYIRAVETAMWKLTTSPSSHVTTIQFQITKRQLVTILAIMAVLKIIWK